MIRTILTLSLTLWCVIGGVVGVLMQHVLLQNVSIWGLGACMFYGIVLYTRWTNDAVHVRRASPDGGTLRQP